MKSSLKRFMGTQPTRFVALGFLIIILSGAFLLTLPFSTMNGKGISFVKALFTATSATCVTGLVVVDTNVYWTVWGKIIILSLIQIGGLGFMSLATLISIVIRRGIGLRERLVLADSVSTNSLSGIIKLVQHILIGTLLFESIGAIILSIRFIPEYGIWDGIFKGIFHSISAFCNAGFDLMGSSSAEFVSLTAYVGDITVNLVIMALIVVGGIGFLVWEDLFNQPNPNKWKLHTKLALIITGALIIFGFLAFLFLEWSNPKTLGALQIHQKPLAAMFMSITPRTAGYNTISISDLGASSKLITVILMFIGGSPGSTAGGIKTIVFGIMIYTLFSVLKGQDYIHAFKKRLTSGTMMRAVTIVILGLTIVFSGTLLILAYENLYGYTRVEPLSALFEVTSAFATVGLTTGITPYLSNSSLILLSLIMFIGRVGIFTTLIAITVKRASSEETFRYPEERIIIG
jgi:trk system potassium uptake protein TrkH